MYTATVFRHFQTDIFFKPGIYPFAYATLFSYLAVLAILSDIVAVPVLTILSKVKMGTAIHIYSVSMKSYKVVNLTLFCIEKHQNIHFGNIIV